MTHSPRVSVWKDASPAEECSRNRSARCERALSHEVSDLVEMRTFSLQSLATPGLRSARSSAEASQSGGPYLIY